MNTISNDSIIKIFESWATTENPLNSTEEILDWVKEKNEAAAVRIRKVPYDYKDGDWFYDEKEGMIRNKNHTFFQISGLQKIRDCSVVSEQPIIIQNEIGYLGIIGKVFNGVMYFLMQAKIEPGNVNKIQISPTIQATKSNFMQTHGGKAPAYLDYFSHKKNYEIIEDQIQSEQSSRFLGKRNRNIIIIVEDDVPVLDSHKWMTLGQIKQLMHYDNLVNMDTRTVISCIPFALKEFSEKESKRIYSLFSDKALYESLFHGSAGYSINRIYQYLNEIKMLGRESIQLVPLESMKSWKFNHGEFCSDIGDFRIVYCDISIEGREVKRWSQPLLEANGPSVFGLMCRIKDGKKQFLIHAKTEVGCFDHVEIGPSVQCEYTHMKPSDTVEAVFKDKMERKDGILFEGVFSEEGGRFYQEQNRNVIMMLDEDELPDLPEGYFWADFQTLNILIQFNNCLNIQLRNLLSILDL